MKVSPMFYVAITTLLLVTITLMCAMNFPFNWVFYLTVIGQILIIVMVYKVLTDNYTTDKTFEHFYEDYPIESIEVKIEEEKFR
ncbi:MAG: DUF2101 family protein [Winogradskyella sp.]|uniref:DUF2101 family protein n=1 Tax=Winogradskyella sp. TaxID=1883156 RepID=UPI0017D56BC0|nr:DUF2101 family protein [Winogradskyella sp.]MBT8245030.1 DUF2101 family protein [Winogradskyella sp.]NNK22128.1 DUF2101 family protein [Winogradskyella sp.]